jgi:hypothetical protein
MTIQFHDITFPGSKAYPPTKMRPFSSTDVEAYDRVKRQGSEASLRNLVGRTLQGVDVNELYEQDFFYAMLWHRVNSFLHFPLPLPWTCPTCEKENTDTLKLEELMSDELPEDYDTQGMSVEYPCGIPLTTRLPKVGDEERARSFLAQMGKGNSNPADTQKAEILQLFEYDTNFNGNEKWEIINRAFTVEDNFAIDAFKRTYNFGPKTVLKCNCKTCGGQQNVGFRFSLLEFLPTDLDRGTIRARILPHPASRDAAKRAKDAIIQKIAVVPTQAAENARRASEAEAEARGEHRSHEAEIAGQGQDAQSSPMMRPRNPEKGGHLANPPPLKGNGLGHPNPGKFGGPPGTPITPQMSDGFASRILEEARTEAILETPQPVRDGQKVTPDQIIDPHK